MANFFILFRCVCSFPVPALLVWLIHPCSEQYNLDYYLNFTRQLKELGIHVLAIKDMAGLLKPEAATMLVRPSSWQTRTPHMGGAVV